MFRCSISVTVIRSVGATVANLPTAMVIVSVSKFMRITLILLTYCIGVGLYGSKDRVRYVDPARQALFAANSVSFPLPGRERRAGKKESNETKPENNNPPTPEPPPVSVTNEVGEGPEDLVERIAELKAERAVLKADVAELLVDLSVASVQLQAYSDERKVLRQEIRDLTASIEAGSGTIFSGWVFSPELKWVYLSPTTIPYIFSQTDGWMLYEYGTNPRRVYYYKTKEWKLLDNEE